MIIDVHAHLNDEKLEKNLKKVLENAKQNQVEKVICVGFDLKSSQRAVEIAEKCPNVFACIGVHPCDAKNFDAKTEQFLLENAKNKKVVAIGEIGLDFHYEPFDKDLQKRVFVEQLKIADKVGLPIQVHSRDATKDTIDILKQNKQYLKNGGIVHCFGGSFETLMEIKKLGLKISVGGVITFKNAKSTLELIEKMPLDMLLLETDCPYLSPVPHRGELNEPKNLIFVAQKIAQIKNLTLEEIFQITSKNTQKVFGI
ncbi:MAG: TatD family hydrolase [Clostridia bacterium]|nr:TatD family hydrolase [Clostridia bacterium]